MPSYSFSSTSFSSETRNGRTTHHTYSEEQHSNPQGTVVQTTTQNGPDAPPEQELRYFDAGGHEIPAGARAAHRGLEGAAPSGGSSRHIEDVSDRAQNESDIDRLYRERMEDEYAKREGGA